MEVIEIVKIVQFQQTHTCLIAPCIEFVRGGLYVKGLKIYLLFVFVLIDLLLLMATLRK